MSETRPLPGRETGYNKAGVAVGIQTNVAKIKRDIMTACLSSGRDVNSVKIIAVSKNFPPEMAQECVNSGVIDLGENRVQELQAKYEHVRGARWHLIGHLQTNKVKYIVDKVHLIHSLDRWNLALELDRRARDKGLVLNTLVQVNVADEETKHGLDTSEVTDFVKEAAGLKGISIRGLMTIGPYVEDPEEVRPVFRQLRLIFHRLNNIPGVHMEQLSMGMTNDFKVAIEEGATMVRIGTAIFGRRVY